jgi:hypothetical protein
VSLLRSQQLRSHSRHFQYSVESCSRETNHWSLLRIKRIEPSLVFFFSKTDYNLMFIYASIFVLGIYCILASCYIRFTLNICSFVHQCNQVIHFLIIRRYDMFWPHTAISRCYSILSRSWCSVMPIFCLSTDRSKQATWRPQRQHNYSNTRTLTISTPSAEAHGWQHYIGKNWHNRAPASVK